MLPDPAISRRGAARRMYGMALEKFERLFAPYADGKLIESIVHAIRRPEDAEICELTELLGRVGEP